MIAIERTLTTDRPVDQVFAYLSDFTRAEEWDPGTVECTLESGDGGVGSVYRNVSRFLGRKTELSYVVQQVESPHRYVIEGKNKTVTSTDTMSVRSVNGGTEVTYHARFEFNGVARYLEPLLRLPVKKLGDDAEKQLGRSLARLP